MAYKDGGKFTTYCDKPYDKCNYIIHHRDGKRHLFFDFDEVKRYWYYQQANVERVEVVDKAGGFKTK
jgi:hypothetical protein